MESNVTVARILDIPLLKEKGTLIAGYEGLDHEVQYVTVMETPDFNVRTLHKKTMVLTTFSSYSRRLEYLNHIVETLCQQGIAALVIKLGRYIDEVDSSTLEIAESYGLPIITVDNTVLFSKMISDILTVVTNSQQTLISGLNELTGALIGGILQNRDMAALVAALTERIPCSCSIFSDAGVLFASRSSSSVRCEEQLARELIQQAKTDKSGSLQSGGYLQRNNTFLFVCYGHGRTLGYLTITLKGDMDEQTLLFIRQIVSFLSIKFLEEHLRIETEQRVILPIIDELLLSSNADEARAFDRLSLLGIVPKDRHIVMLLTSATPDDDLETARYRHLDFWKAQFSKAFININVFLKGEDYIILASFAAGSKYNSANAVRDKLSACLPLRDFDKVLGVGKLVESIGDLSHSYRQAKQSLRFGRRMSGESRIYVYDDYLELGVLSNCLDTMDYELFRSRVIDPIVHYNGERDSNLWATLECCVTEKSLDRASKELFIHISTLRYRLQKIAELTGFDFSTPNGRFVLNMAVVLYRMDDAR